MKRDSDFSAPVGPLGLDADCHEALAILARPSGGVLRALVAPQYHHRRSTMPKAKKKQKTQTRHVLVGNQSYGLYIGETDATDQEIVASRSVRLRNCRHVAKWYGRTGGVTSLAAHGPCGPRANDSRVGAPADALLTGVVNVFDLSPEAIAAFAAIVPE